MELSQDHSLHACVLHTKSMLKSNFKKSADFKAFSCETRLDRIHQLPISFGMNYGRCSRVRAFADSRSSDDSTFETVSRRRGIVDFLARGISIKIHQVQSQKIKMID